MKGVLLGYGTIGKGVEDLARQVEDLEITNVFVLPEFVDEPYFTNDGMALVGADPTEIVFECLSGVEPANTLIREALKKGKHVITSNKAVVSQNLEDYVALAEESGGSLSVEASVAGGIPFLDALLKYKELEKLDGYEGIFNGTSNYILDLMQKEGMDPALALKEAQAKGYAEFDPTNDIEGIDAWYKAIIANALAYNSYEPGLRKPLGISRLDEKDIALAKEKGKVIRHLVNSAQTEDGFDTLVAPAFLSPDEYLANIPLNYNAQLIYAPSFEKIGLFGQGAGRYPTAQAMIHNAIDVIKGHQRPIRLNETSAYVPGLIEEDWLVRSGKDLSGLEGFTNKEEKEGRTYYWFEDRGGDLIEEVQSLDPEAMIAIWRE